MVSGIKKPNRSLLLTLFSCCLFAGPLKSAYAVEQPPPPKVIFFDVNETLLKLDPLEVSVSAALNGRHDLLKLWFTTMLQHSLVETATGQYHDFGQVGAASLMMMAEANNIVLSTDKAASALAPIKSLPPYGDVKNGLEQLRRKGYTLIALTNSSRDVVKQQLKNAHLIQLFDGYLSGESVKSYKPDLRVYQFAAKSMQVPLPDTMLVAAHGWDIDGAKAAGMQAAFIARPGQTLYPLSATPEYNVKNLIELARVLPDKKQ